MSLAGLAVVSIWHDIAPEGRDAFYAWHVHEHMSERVAIPGFLRGRRYIAEYGEPEFFNLYEAQSLATLAGPGYLDRLNDPTPWTMSTVQHFRHVARAIQRVQYSTGSGMGGHLLTLQMQVKTEPAGSFADELRSRVLLPASERHGICGVHLCESDLAVSTTPTKEKQARSGDTQVPAWAILIEGASSTVVEQVRQDIATDAALQQAGADSIINAALYRLEYVRNQNDAGA